MLVVRGPQKIGDVRWRDVATVEGTVRSLRARPWAENVASVECTLVDGSGGLELVFLGRRIVGGVGLGTRMRAAGRVGAHHGRLAILNPVYELMSAENS